MPHFYLNSYAPLVASKAGRDASILYGIEPFVDGSIRREPDLENRFPAISCLCRADKFAPRLEVGDIVAYMLRKDRYGENHAQRRLTTVLRVIDTFQSHTAGAQWYLDQNLVLPNNCWVRGNPAKPFEQSHRLHKFSKTLDAIQLHHAWDASYRGRAMKHGTFVVCESLYRNLDWSAPEVTETQLKLVFGAVPGTRNPGQWTIKHAERLLSLLSIDVPLFVP